MAGHERRSRWQAPASRPAAAIVPPAPGLRLRGHGRSHAVGGDGDGGPNKILDPETGTVRRELGIHPDGEVQALSGDGRWAASCGWHSDSVRLWNRRARVRWSTNGSLESRTLVFFTPDSRALIIARGDAFSFWDVETLRPIRRLRRDVAQFPGWVAFSPDGRLMALEMAPAVIHLKEVATGRTVAKLEDPHGDRATWQGFTPDGTQFVVLAAHTRAIHIWDLRAIRTRLKEMNLDWDWPEFPPAATGDTAAEPLMIEVVSGDRAGDRADTASKGSRQAIERARRDCRGAPGLGNRLQQPGLVMLTAPEALARCGGRCALGRESRAAAPQRMRTSAQYARPGLLSGRPLSRGGGGPLGPTSKTGRSTGCFPSTCFFLAMSFHRLGETERARDYYDLRSAWSNATRPRRSPARRARLVSCRSRAALGARAQERLKRVERHAVGVRHF